MFKYINVLLIVYTVGIIESKVFPVYSRPGRNIETDNDTLEVFVNSQYAVENQAPEDRSFDTRESKGSWTNEEEDVLIASERDACLTSGTLGQCWKYKALRFVQYMMQPMGVPMISNFSTARSFDEPQLIAMPNHPGNMTLVILGRAAKSGMGEVLSFLERQFARFLARHGVVFTAVSYDEVDSEKIFEAPILLGSENSNDLNGLFRLCRPGVPGFNPPFGLTSAGLLQEVGDSRGEFSNIYNTYASPYRDSHGYRTRQLGRYSANTASPEREEPLPDY